MIENQNIVFFGPTDWYFMNPSSGTHIARKLSAKNKVLYINPMSTDLSGTVKSTGMSGKLLMKIKRKLISFSRSAKKIDDNLYVFSPVFIPIQGSSFWDFINNVVIKLQLDYRMKKIGMKNSILWIENLRAVDVVRKKKWLLTVLHASDIFTEDRYVKNKSKLIKRDDYVTRHSDVIICVSKELFDLKKKANKNCFYLPHGVDFDLFRDAAEKKTIHPLIKGLKRPIVGYFGTLTQSNDVELAAFLAEKMKDVTFVYAGQVTGGDYSSLMKYKNVRFVGKIPYEEIPALCSSFDVCIMFWKMSKWIKHCNPLKLFEYMASGKPIVTIPIDEIVKNYSDIVSIAYDHKQFAEAIAGELKKDSKKRMQKRIETAHSHSWDAHMEKISEIIEKAITKKGRKRR